MESKVNMHTQVPQDLWTAKKVFVRVNKIQHSPEPKYTGPFRDMREIKVPFSNTCFHCTASSMEKNRNYIILVTFYSSITYIYIYIYI